MSHSCRGPRKTPKNLDAGGVHLPCIRGAVDGNVAQSACNQLAVGSQSAEKSTVIKLKPYGEFKANTRRVQGEPKANTWRVQGKHEVNTGCFKAEHRMSPR